MVANRNLPHKALSGRSTTGGASGNSTQLQSQLTSIQNQVNGISVDSTQIGTNQSNITAHGSRLTTAESDITSNDGDITLLNNSLSDKANKSGDTLTNVNLNGTTDVDGSVNLDAMMTVSGTGHGITIANTANGTGGFGFSNDSTSHFTGNISVDNSADITRNDDNGQAVNAFDSIEDHATRITTVENDKAPKNNPTLTGSITLNGNAGSGLQMATNCLFTKGGVVGATQDITRTVSGVSTGVFATLADLTAETYYKRTITPSSTNAVGNWSQPTDATKNHLVIIESDATGFTTTWGKFVDGVNQNDDDDLNLKSGTYVIQISFSFFGDQNDLDHYYHDYFGSGTITLDKIICDQGDTHPDLVVPISWVGRGLNGTVGEVAQPRLEWDARVAPAGSNAIYHALKLYLPNVPFQTNGTQFAVVALKRIASKMV